jgi:hypothetical protein
LILAFALSTTAAAVAAEVACTGEQAAPTGEVSCPKYCGDIMQACTGDDLQYPDLDTCNRICGTFGVNGLGQNTIQCRLTALSDLKEAKTPAEKHLACGNAGLSSGLCPNRCEGFCTANLALCGTKSGSAPERYLNVETCKSECAKFRDSNAQTFPGPLLGSTGDDLQCRTYHLELSQTGKQVDLITHCPHTVPENKSKCSDPAPGDGGTDGSADATTD